MARLSSIKSLTVWLPHCKHPMLQDIFHRIGKGKRLDELWQTDPLSPARVHRQPVSVHGLHNTKILVGMST